MRGRRTWDRSPARQVVGAGPLGYVFLGFVMATVLFPTFVALTTSLKRAGDVYRSPAGWLPRVVDFANYVAIFQRVPLGRAFGNSVAIAGGATALTLVCALPAGYALARYTFPGRRAVLLAILSIIMFSPIVVIIALFQIMASYGLLNHWYSVSVADCAFALPFSIWIMMSYFQTIPRELDEAGEVDGASPLRVFWQLLLPVALPGVATVLIFAFVQAWNDFLLANTLLTNQAEFPLPVTIFDFVAQHGVQWQYLTASVVVASLPALVLFMAVQRMLVRGLTAGALK